MRILIYYPYNLPSIEQESVMKMLVSSGHQVVLLTTCEPGPLHHTMAKAGVSCYAAPKGWDESLRFFPGQWIRLTRICKAQAIEWVIAHQQRPALLAALGQLRCRYRLAYVRHNTDEDYLATPVKARVLNRIVNRLTPLKVAPSEAVLRYWSGHEGVPEAQILRINYGYEFEDYAKPDAEEVSGIKKEFSARHLFVTVARLVPAKRYELLLEVARRLRDRGVDFDWLCVGEGPLRERLEAEVGEQGLQSCVHFLGHRNNVMDYLEAADAVVHLSVTEASNSAVKEAGLRRKLVLACDQVGDFPDYLQDGLNGYLLPKHRPVERAFEILWNFTCGRVDATALGEELYSTVYRRFHISQVAPMYQRLLETSGDNA